MNGKRQRPQAPSRIRGRRGATAFRRQAAQLRAQAIQAGRRARRELLILLPLMAAIIAAYVFRRELFGLDRPVRLATAGALVVVGWAIARSLGRALQPRLMHRLDPGAAGVAGFMVRLVALLVIALVSLRLAGLTPRTLALGASFTAVIIGLAAQQTVGNVIAGVVLLSAQPFQVGDRVRFTGFGMEVEGTVTAHGLLYLTLADGDDLVRVPNSTALSMANRPLREPAAVDMLARLPPGVDPEAIQHRVDQRVTVPTKRPPHVQLEEFDGDEVVVRIRAVPEDYRNGARLSREVLETVAAIREELSETAGARLDAHAAGPS